MRSRVRVRPSSTGIDLRSRHRRRVVVSAALALMVSATASSAQTPASKLPRDTLANYLGTYIKSCRTGTGDKDSSFGLYFCSCAAAFTMDRFTLDQMSDSNNNNPEKLDKISPGYLDVLKACATAATHRND